jgi:hypothetical protein
VASNRVIALHDEILYFKLQQVIPSLSIENSPFLRFVKKQNVARSGSGLASRVPMTQRGGTDAGSDRLRDSF